MKERKNILDCQKTIKNQTKRITALISDTDVEISEIDVDTWVGKQISLDKDMALELAHKIIATYEGK